MLWIKAFHLIFMVTWFAGMFYLPRLFVYHAMADDEPSIKRFETMERKLFFGIMTPGGILTLVFGLALLRIYNWETLAILHWLHVKLVLIALLVAYHVWCGVLLQRFRLRILALLYQRFRAQESFIASTKIPVDCCLWRNH